MNWPQNFKFSDALKISGVVLIAFAILSVGVSLVSTPFSGMMQSFDGDMFQNASTDNPAPMYDKMTEEVSLSARNVGGTVMPPQTPGTSGNDAENYEVVNYTGRIATGNISKTCGTIASLKAKDYVVFENSNESDAYCNYTFKVATKHVAEVKSIIEDLDPEELTENKYTIKNQVEDFTSETDILKKKAEVIDTTLKNAVAAYDEITTLASRTQDATALAKVIDSKIQTIERLTQERLNITTQLDRLARGKAEQLDRLEYTYFTLNVYENKYFDGEALRNSWKNALHEFVYDLNDVTQALTLGLVSMLFWGAQFIVLFFIIVFVAKYVWRGTVKIWSK